MKPAKLLVLLSAFALVACGTPANQSSSINNDSTSVEDTSSSADDSSNEESSNSQGTSTSTSESSSSSSSSSGSSTTLPDGTLKKTVTFYNGGFTGALDQANKRDAFVTWFNNGDNTLRSIDCDGYVQINGIDDDNNTTMILGSRNSEGKLTFNFNYPIYSVKAVVQPYTKYISYNNTYNNDKGAKLYIDTTEYDLSLDASYSGPTENKTFEKVLTGTPSKFSIANKEENQRVFVHSLEIVYYTID